MATHALTDMAEPWDDLYDSYAIGDDEETEEDSAIASKIAVETQYKAIDQLRQLRHVPTIWEEVRHCIPPGADCRPRFHPFRTVPPAVTAGCAVAAGRDQSPMHHTPDGIPCDA